MKKNIYFLLMALLVTMMSLGLSSCSKDDDESSFGSESESSVSLVGKTFYKSETSYSNHFLNEDKETISFTTQSKCTVRYWGTSEYTYKDGSVDKEKYDTGEMSCSYSISGVTVSIRVPGYDIMDYTIVNGGLLGFKQIKN